MYYLMIVLLMGMLPVLSVLVEHALDNADWIVLAGRWFVFWAVGVRLAMAGARQIADPAFTAKTIFEIATPGAEKIVTELGFANLAMGLLGLVAVLRADWVLPAAIVSGLYYGLAGGLHIFSARRNRTETWAMASDLWIFVILTACVAVSLVRRG